MITLKNKSTGMIKECVTGYSWTTFFFGVFVPLLRGDLKWAIILFIITILVAACTLGFGVMFVGPIFAYFYNKIFIKSMVEKGFSYADDAAKNYLVRNGIIDAEPVPTETAMVELPSKDINVQ